MQKIREQPLLLKLANDEELPIAPFGVNRARTQVHHRTYHSTSQHLVIGGGSAFVCPGY